MLKKNIFSHSVRSRNGTCQVETLSDILLIETGGVGEREKPPGAKKPFRCCALYNQKMNIYKPRK